MRSQPNEIDLVADLNAQDADGLGWSTLADARESARVVPGAMLLAGNEAARAVVRVAVEKNRHLLGKTVA